MPSNFLRNGVDLDSVFEPYLSGTKKPATGFTAAGVDLSDKYAPIELGAAAAATNFLAGGADLNTKFAAIGTVSYVLAGLQGKQMYALDDRTSGSTLNASVTLTLNNSGGWTAVGANTSGAVAQPAPTSGTWLPSGTVGEYEVQFDVTPVGTYGVTTTVTNGAAAWASLSTSRALTLQLAGTRTSSGGTDRASFANIRVRVRRVSGQVVVSDTTLTMNVECYSML
jgi:hypothetical protein